MIMIVVGEASVVVTVEGDCVTDDHVFPGSELVCKLSGPSGV